MPATAEPVRFVHSASSARPVMCSSIWDPPAGRALRSDGGGAAGMARRGRGCRRGGRGVRERVGCEPALRHIEGPLLLRRAYHTTGDRARCLCGARSAAASQLRHSISCGADWAGGLACAHQRVSAYIEYTGCAAALPRSVATYAAGGLVGVRSRSLGSQLVRRALRCGGVPALCGLGAG